MIEDFEDFANWFITSKFWKEDFGDEIESLMYHAVGAYQYDRGLIDEDEEIDEQLTAEDGNSSIMYGEQAPKLLGNIIKNYKNADFRQKIAVWLFDDIDFNVSGAYHINIELSDIMSTMTRSPFYFADGDTFYEGFYEWIALKLLPKVGLDNSDETVADTVRFFANNPELLCYVFGTGMVLNQKNMNEEYIELLAEYLIHSY